MNARFVKDVAEFFVNYNRQDDVIISFWEPKGSRSPSGSGPESEAKLPSSSAA
jgi:hypothetical protein